MIDESIWSFLIMQLVTDADQDIVSDLISNLVNFILHFICVGMRRSSKSAT